MHWSRSEASGIVALHAFTLFTINGTLARSTDNQLQSISA